MHREYVPVAGHGAWLADLLFNFYLIFKTRFKQEKYLSLYEFKERKILSKFKISVHRLEIQQARYTYQKRMPQIVSVSNLT